MLPALSIFLSLSLSPCITIPFYLTPTYSKELPLGDIPLCHPDNSYIRMSQRCLDGPIQVVVSESPEKPLGQIDRLQSQLVDVLWSHTGGLISLPVTLWPHTEEPLQKSLWCNLFPFFIRKDLWFQQARACVSFAVKRKHLCGGWSPAQSWISFLIF